MPRIMTANRISVNENPQEKPELAFVDGQSLSVQLRNDDPVTYPFTWEMLIKGKSKKGSGQIGPNGVATIAVAPDPEWFSAYQSFFKDEPVDGKLTLRYQPKGAQSEDFYPAKPIPIKARLSSFTPGRREAQSTLVILLALAFGGILSSYFNVDLVNRLRMVGIKKRLGRLVKETGEISPQLTSQLRVTLLLEHKRVVADLPKGVFFTPETASVLAQSATDTDGLEMRVNLAVQIADAAARLGRGTDTGMIAQSLADRVDRDLSSAQDLLRKSTLSAAEQQKVQTGIADAVNVLDALDAPDTALEETLAARLKDLQARFTDGLKGDPIYVQIKSQVPVPFLLLTPGRSAGSQAERDASSLKLKVIADLIEMQAKPSTEMIDALRRQDPHSVRSAELLLRELKDEVTPEDLRDAIQASPPQFSILIDRDVVRVNRASLMRVVFNNQRYNQASAKSLIECTWHFGHLKLTERGWEVFHYFPAVRPEPYQVDVTFKDEKQNDLSQGIPAQSLSIEVQPPYSEGSPHWAIEIQRWLIGFLVAVLGLFAGAKDKITTLDTLGTLFAVFLLGFAVDMAKNLILPKTS